jgi:hypothetical protein
MIATRTFLLAMKLDLLVVALVMKNLVLQLLRNLHKVTYFLTRSMLYNSCMATNERIDHLERLLEVVRGLTTAPDLESFLQTIISEASEMTNSELASILEYDEIAGNCVFSPCSGSARCLLRPWAFRWMEARPAGSIAGTALDHPGCEGGSTSLQVVDR